jgi:hypothetical protein
MEKTIFMQQAQDDGTGPAKHQGSLARWLDILRNPQYPHALPLADSRAAPQLHPGSIRTHETGKF